ncbi:MAG: V-type ATP synthase subunit E family protein [Clostridia bacterium]|nr:V-type ATP synthase subunit E family protein [Clostridia bacterium]
MSEAIINKILANADTKAKGITDEANARAAEITANARSEVTAAINRFNEQTPSFVEGVTERAVAVAKLDVKKDELGKKRELLNKAYVDAASAINRLPDDEYLKFIASMLNKYAEEGEKLVVAGRDKARVTQAFLDKNVKIKLEIVGYGQFEGGVVLTTPKYDKNLTTDVIVGELVENSEKQVARILFDGEGK